MTDEMWKPKVGDTVWLNNFDQDDPLGVVVGFNPDDADHRPGQPIIKRHRDGAMVNTYVGFLLPFRCGGPEWQKARDEGLLV